MSEWNHKFYEKHKPKFKAVLISLSIISVLIISLTVWERIAFSQTFPQSSENVEIDGINFSLDTDTYRFYSWSGYYLRFYFELIVDQPISTIGFEFNATRVWLIPVSGIWGWKFYYETSLIFYRESVSSVTYILNYTEAKNSNNYANLGDSGTFDVIIAINHTLDSRWVFLHQEGIKI